MFHRYQALPESLRKVLSTLIKAVCTVSAFYMLLTHPIDTGDGETMSMGAAIIDHLADIKLTQFLPFVIAAIVVKFVGIFCSMLRWHLLLQGQGIRFNFGHIVGSFLIGRFLGTFLPSTLGLDSYKLYDAAKFSKRLVEPTAATVVEKTMGLGGIFLTFLITLPLGYPILYDVFGSAATTVLTVTLGVSLGIVGGLFAVLFHPRPIEKILSFVQATGRGRIEKFVKKVSGAATAYGGRSQLLLAVMGLSFMVHFTTAAMYYFTALAVGAMDAQFWHVAFASSIQIFATVLSPFTIGGEGIREIVQMLLLTKHMGASQAILSAALGFWAAEALTLIGAVFWWTRRRGYTPKVVALSGIDDDTQTCATMTAA